LPKWPLQTPRKDFLSLPALLGLLLLATTATAGELCVNYISDDASRSALTSFDPRSRESIVVAMIDFVPNFIVWEKDFGAVVYGSRHRLEWKSGAVPTLLPRESWVGPWPRILPPQQLGKLWTPDAAAYDAELLTFDAPAHRKITVVVSACDFHAGFGTPITWSNTETGESKTLLQRLLLDVHSPCTHPLQISTADNFILIAEKFSGADAIVADMNTGEVLLRAGDHSRATGWGKCPEK
jgi:hypothetical protein